jgi:biphenyl-2,3-diol 1,2-dioxygenase
MMGTSIMELGYVAMEVSDLAAWRSFAVDVLGLDAVAGPVPDSLKLRLDEQDYRILLLTGPADDIAYAGWRVADIEALHRFAHKLDGLHLEYGWLGETECSIRSIDAALTVVDPQGLRHEIFVGDLKGREPFTSKLAQSGFVTGAGGLGHIVFGSTDYGQAVAFAKNVLEAQLSDTIVMRLTPEIAADVTFLHVNERHHSIAFANRSGRKRLHHLMLEVGSVGDVGRARDRHLKAGLPVAQDIGQHPNDKMISYYGVTPSGFLIEYGCGGVKVNQANWQPGHYTQLSEWGHRPFGALPPGAPTPGAPSPHGISEPQNSQEKTMSVDGPWTLTLNTPMGPQPSKLVLAVAVGVVTGTLGTPGGDVAVLEGTLTGAALHWKSDLTVPFPMTLTFDLNVAGGQLAGTAEGIMGKIPVTGVRAS